MSEEDALKFCTNCKRDVPQGNFIMHSMHCQRNLALCTKCDEPIPVVELKSHNDTFHKTVECPACDMKVEKMNLSEHEQNACKRRAICCNYCHIETEANELQEHENYCGSRTEKCAECGEFVMLKYTQLHLDSNHGFLKLDEEPGPTPSWSKPQPSSSTGLLNDLGGSRIRKVPNAIQNPARMFPLSTASSDSSVTSTAIRNVKLDSIPPLSRNNDYVLPASYSQANYGHSARVSQDPIRSYLPWNSSECASESSSRNPPDLVRGNQSRNTQDPVYGSTLWNSSQDSARPLSARSTVPEAVRPSAAGNRLSPSKRTNDMPQVNSTAAVAIPKALHKPVIRQSDNERLLAGLSKPDLELNPYAIANNMMGNLDLDLGGGEMVALPCEFCEAMIPANQLVIHETGCRPDLACFKTQAHPDVLGENGLPCEFCGGLYPPHNLLSHQAHCELPFRGDVLVNEFDLPAVKDVNVIKKKQSNLTEERQWLPQHQRRQSPLPPFRISDDSWQKPTANVNPIAGLRQPTTQGPTPGGPQNGHQQRPMSTGAVPKQKAGARPSLHEVQQEVPRPSSASVAPRNFETQR